jgi:hypothetical protein
VIALDNQKAVGRPPASIVHGSLALAPGRVELAAGFVLASQIATEAAELFAIPEGFPLKIIQENSPAADSR